MARKISKALEDAVCRGYKAGLSTLDLAEQHDICAATAYNILIRNCVEIRDPAQVARKYTLDEGYFDEINTPDKAYFLGLLYADGFNNRKKREVVLQLSLQDKSILDKFSECLSTNKPLGIVRSKRNNDMWKLTINSGRISKRLEELGCGYKKSLTLEYPTWMPDWLQRHFIRGYFDGDGGLCFTVRDGHYSTVTWSFINTENFCDKAKNIVSRAAGVNVTLRKHHTTKEMSYITVGGRLQVLKVCEWMYSGADQYLPRKKDLYIELRDVAQGFKKNYCTVEGCGAEAHGYSLCRHHYNIVFNEMRRKRFQGTVEEYLETKKKRQECSLLNFINNGL